MFALLSSFVSLAAGQSATGEVTGTITDTAGALIGGASVRLQDTAKGVTGDAKTNSSGYYVFINVQPGSYVLTVETAGFKTAQAKFDLSVNQTVSQNVKLDLGSVHETITVSCGSPFDSILVHKPGNRHFGTGC